MNKLERVCFKRRVNNESFLERTGCWMWISHEKTGYLPKLPSQELAPSSIFKSEKIDIYFNISFGFLYLLHVLMSPKGVTDQSTLLAKITCGDSSPAGLGTVQSGVPAILHISNKFNIPNLERTINGEYLRVTKAGASAWGCPTTVPSPWEFVKALLGLARGWSLYTSARCPTSVLAGPSLRNGSIALALDGLKSPLITIQLQNKLLQWLNRGRRKCALKMEI